MDDRQFESMLQGMQESLENKVTRDLLNRPNRRVQDRQRYLSNLLTQWQNVKNPEEKDAMKNRVVNLLKRREELGRIAS